MSKISKEFIQRIAKDKLDDFLYYTEPLPNDVLYGIKYQVTIKGFIIKQDLQNPEIYTIISCILLMIINI